MTAFHEAVLRLEELLFLLKKQLISRITEKLKIIIFLELAFMLY